MQSIARLHASDESGNASVATVQTVRAPLASTLAVDTVEGISATFFGSMGTPHTFVDPITSEEITVISDATAVDFAGHVDGGNLEIDTIAPGYTDDGSAVGDIVIIRPTTDWSNNVANVLAKSMNDDGSLNTTSIAAYQPLAADFIQTGGVWSSVSGLNGAMTALTCYQAGYLGSVAAVVSRAFTASKDTYIDVLRTLTGFTNVFTLVYTEVANGAASPALAANSVRLAVVVSGASTLTLVMTGGFDSLGNRITPATAVTGDKVPTMWYEEVGRATLLSAAASLSVINIPNRKYLRIIANVAGIGTTGEFFRFNNDSGANYDYRRAIGAAASTLNTAQTQLDAYGDLNAESWGEYDIINPALNNKVLQGKRTVGYPNGGSGVQYVDISAVWRNATVPINRIDYFSGAQFTIGSELIILGHN